MKKFIGILILVCALFVACGNGGDPDPVVNLEKRYVEPAARGAYLASNSRNADSSEYEEVELENGETIEVLKITLNSYEEFLKNYNQTQGWITSETFFTLEWVLGDSGGYYKPLLENHARYLGIMDRLGNEEEVVFSNYGYNGYAWSLGTFIEYCAHRDCLFTSKENENNKVYFVFDDEHLNLI